MSSIVASLNKGALQSVAPIVTPIHVTVDLAAISNSSIKSSSWVSTVGCVDNSSSSWVSTVNLGSADDSQHRSNTQAAISLPDVPQSLLLVEATAEQLPECVQPANDENAALQDLAQLFAEPVVPKKTARKSTKEKDRRRVNRFLANAAVEFTRTEQQDAKRMVSAFLASCYIIPAHNCALCSASSSTANPNSSDSLAFANL